MLPPADALPLAAKAAVANRNTPAPIAKEKIRLTTHHDP
jgi:hypothetical protein